MKKQILSFKYAIEGIAYGVKNQRNLKIHFSIAILSTLLGFYFKLSSTEWVSLMLTYSTVIVSEMINTAIEKTVDLLTEEYSILAKRAKDVAAGAVLIAAILSVIIGVIIFLPKILYKLQGG